MTFRRTAFAASLATAVLTTTMAADAEGTGACEPFTMISDGSARTVAYVDVGGDGLGVGDQRIGRRDLVDLEGRPIGYLRWIWTNTELHVPGDNGGAGEAYVAFTAVLEDGLIMFNHLVTTDRPANDTSQISWSIPPEGVITGGSGAYAGAEGTVALSRDGLVLTLEVDVDCGR